MTDVIADPITDTVVLGKNQYGKAENHVVRVNRDSARHEIRDIVVTSQLRGDFEAVHTQGDNSHCVPTDTQKNTIFAFAQQYGITSPETFALELADHFTTEFEWATGGRWAAEEYRWRRINDHDHSFVKTGEEVRTAVVVADGVSRTVISGFKGLTVLKSTQSGFVGYPQDKYTTLFETEDRILSTEVSTRWQYNTTSLDFDGIYESVKNVVLTKFTDHYSRALQETLYLMGKAVIEDHPEIDVIKFSCPNKHHFVYDLGFCDLQNNNETHYAADRPYGLQEVTVLRKGASEDENAWAGIAGFC